MATKAITYLQAEGDVEACFAARGAHNLFLEGEAQRHAILGSIAGVSLVDGIKELEWPALAELIMPFVTLAADARGAGYGAVYIDDDVVPLGRSHVRTARRHGYVRMEQVL